MKLMSYEAGANAYWLPIGGAHGDRVGLAVAVEAEEAAREQAEDGDDAVVHVSVARLLVAVLVVAPRELAEAVRELRHVAQRVVLRAQLAPHVQQVVHRVDLHVHCTFRTFSTLSTVSSLRLLNPSVRVPRNPERREITKESEI